MNRKPTFFTSDWHLFHENSLKFDSRPFKDVHHMHRVLVNNFNSTVMEEAVTYFLGDIGLSKLDLIEPIIRSLHGTKVLILGNHDKQHTAMYNIGFDVVLNAATLYIAGQRVTMSHCPLLGLYREDTSQMKNAHPGALWHGDHKQHAYTMPNEGQFHLHGHIHSPNSGKSQKILGRQYDVGVVANNYRPVPIAEIESWVAKSVNSGVHHAKPLET